MTDSVIYTDIKFKKSTAEESGVGVGILPINCSDTQTQCNSKIIWVLCGAIFILSIAVIGMAIEMPACPVGWVTYKDLCYLIEPTMLTRSLALKSCSFTSSQLVNTEDSNTLRFLEQYMADMSYWIGLNRLANENRTSWFWTDGRQLQKTRFFNNTDHSKRSCATVSKNTIFAEKCNVRRPYICEKKASAYA